MSNPNSSQATAESSSDKAINATMPQTISLDKWADTGFEWQGLVAPTSFERLATNLTNEHEQTNLQLNMTLYRRNNVLHLAFTLTGDVWLTCQRCLQPIAIDLSDDYDIALLEDESQVNMVREEQDYLILDEIITEPAPESLLPVKKLVEDEILLKTPLAPKHEDCEMAIDQVGDIPEEEVENPFAALASLKGKL